MDTEKRTHTYSASWSTSAVEDGVQEVKLDSWRDFGYFIQEKLDFPQYIWRGQKRADWLLEPTLDRQLRKLKKLGDNKIRTKHLDNFIYATRGRRGDNPCTYETPNNWWALGQHHGLLTPLLDWTTSPYVALFFAFAEVAAMQKIHRVVWSLSQNAINTGNKLTTEKNVIEVFKPITDDNARLVNQGGLFTRSPDGLDIEKWVRAVHKGETHKVRLRKIIIPNIERNSVLKFLNRMNINYLTLFPDLIGASLHANLSLILKNY